MATEPIKVLLVDDHPTLRMGIGLILGAEPDMCVVAQAGNGEEALAKFRDARPDITLMDLKMSGMSGVDALTAIKAEYPAARIIMLTAYDRDEDIYQSVRSGAMGYLVKGMPVDEILAAIRSVAQGRKHFPLHVSEKLAGRLAMPDMSEREHEVLRLMAIGHSNKEIGQSLSLSLSAVKYHVNNILGKLGVEDRTQAVVAALKRGLTELE